MEWEAWKLSFADFCKLVLMKVSVGTLNGVFARGDCTVMDVFLPSQTAELGRKWQGHIYVRNEGSNLMEYLRNLHRVLVLGQRRRYRDQVRQIGHAICDAPNWDIVQSYRIVKASELMTSFDRILADPYQVYRGIPVSHTLYAFPMGIDVTISFCPKQKMLYVTDQDGEKLDPIKLDSFDRKHVFQTIKDFLSSQQIIVEQDIPWS